MSISIPLSLSLSVIDLPDGVFQGTFGVANRPLERTISEVFVKRGRGIAISIGN